MPFLLKSGGGELTVSAHHRRILGEMASVNFAYEVILKETQPKVGLSKSSTSDQKQTHGTRIAVSWHERLNYSV